MKKVICFMMISLLFFTGCQPQPSEKVLSYQTNYEITGDEKEKLLENMSESIYDSIDRTNAMAKEMVVDAIYKEGKDITVPEGRYQISGQLSGNVYIRDENGGLLLHELIAPPPLGIETITVDLSGSHIIHVNSFEQVFITPVETKVSTDLSTGIWEVGKDIKEGTYVVTGDDLGYLQIFEKGQSPHIYEVIGGDSGTKIDVLLKKGQKLKITGTTQLHFGLKQ